MKETLENRVRRVDQLLQTQVQSLEDHKKLFDVEMVHINKRVDNLEEGNKDLGQEIKNIPAHICTSVSRIDDIKESMIENERAIKRLYVWLSGIGISLLLFFLTMGVASLRYVDNLNYVSKENQEDVQKTKEDIQKIEKKLEKRDEEEKKILKNTLREVFRDTLPFYDSTK